MLKKNTGKYMGLVISGLLMSMELFMTESAVKKVAAAETELAGAESKAEEENSGNIFQVLFPANAEHVFDFIMDPQQLIGMTDAAAYGDCVFEEGATLFFRRSDGGVQEDYSSSSDKLVITNVGTADVDIVLNARISSDSQGGIVMANDRYFTENEDPALYLALTDGERTVPVDSETGASINTRLEGVSGEAEEYSTYRFWLTGACNEGGDWSNYTGSVPKVIVTWDVIPVETKIQEEREELQENGGSARMEDLREEKTSEADSDVEETDISGNEGKSETSDKNEMKDETDVLKVNEKQIESEVSVDSSSQEENEIPEDNSSQKENEIFVDDSDSEENETSADNNSPEENEISADNSSPEKNEASENNNSSDVNEMLEENEKQNENRASKDVLISTMNKKGVVEEISMLLNL